MNNYTIYIKLILTSFLKNQRVKISFIFFLVSILVMVKSNTII